MSAPFLRPAVRPLVRTAHEPQMLNDLMLDRLTTAKRVAIGLKREGFTVLQVLVDAHARPTITVQHCRRCDARVQSGQAAYYKWTHGHGGRETWGQWQVDDCRVLWVERA